MQATFLSFGRFLPGRAQRRSKSQTSSKPMSELNSAKLKSGRLGEFDVPSVLSTVQRIVNRGVAAASPVAEGKIASL